MITLLLPVDENYELDKTGKVSLDDNLQNYDELFKKKTTYSAVGSSIGKTSNVSSEV